MNEIKIFNYNNNEVRVIEQNGEPWFIAKDVCEALGLEQVSRALRGLKKNDSRLLKVTHPQNPQKKIEVNVVSEPGLYKLIFKSRKPEAEQFQDWVYYKVLPDIRKHGMYISEALMDQLVSNPLVFEQVCTSYIENKLPSLDKTSLMVLGYSVHLGRTLFVVKEAANILRQFGLQIGEYQLWRMLREDGFASRHMGKRWNVATQKGIDEGVVAMAYTGKRPLTMLTISGVRHYAQKLVLRDFPLLAS